MFLSSNNDVYTVQSNMNLGIRVSTHYVGQNDNIDYNHGDTFNVLFFAKRNAVEKLAVSLDQWASTANTDPSISRRGLSWNCDGEYEAFPISSENKTNKNQCQRSKIAQISLAFENNSRDLGLKKRSINGSEKVSPDDLGSFSRLRSNYDVHNLLVKRDISSFEDEIAKANQDSSEQLNSYKSDLSRLRALSDSEIPAIEPTVDSNIQIQEPLKLKVSQSVVNGELDKCNSENSFPSNGNDSFNEPNRLAPALRYTISPVRIRISDPVKMNTMEIKIQEDFRSQPLSRSDIKVKAANVEASKNLVEDEKKVVIELRTDASPVPLHNLISDRSHLYRLFTLFETFYFEGVYKRELLTELNHREQLILCKIMKVAAKEIPKLVSNSNLITAISDKYFSNDTKRKGYKITNNKRFVFRKIRAILYKKMQCPKLGTKASKKLRDAKFFLHYFQNAPEYSSLTSKERADVKSLLRTYEESKISIIWRFRHFTEDFSNIFFNFPQEMMKTYYMKKVSALKFCIEYMNDKSDDFILRSAVPIKCLPRPLSVIKQYMADFFNSFGEYLTKE